MTFLPTTNEGLMWLGILIWVGFGLIALFGLIFGSNTTKLPSGGTVIAGGS